MLRQILGWRFDPISALVTLILGPILIVTALVIRRFISNSAKYVLDGIVYGLNKTFIHKTAATLTLRRYCRIQLAGPNQFLRVPSAMELNLKIDDLFVPLLLEQQGLQQGYNDSTILSAGTRIRIIGDPGSGKSSIAKKIFRDECSRALDVPRRTRFPILLELRSIDIPVNTSKAKLQDWLLNYIEKQIDQYEVYELHKCFDAFSVTAGLLVILDGLDEVASSAYGRMETAINGLSQKLGQLSDNNVVLLTMRTQFHQQVRSSYSETFPIVLSIRSFLPSDIYEFPQRWPFPITAKAKDVVRIYNDLTDRPTLREMCTNPLVLSMYVAQDQTSGQHIAPDSRTDFYQKVVEELLIKRRAKQIGPIESQAIVREQRQRILGLIAFKHLLDPDQTANRIAWKFGIETVVEVTKLETHAAEAYFRELSKETGLVTEEQEGESFRYIHLTFCEYFAAFEAIQGRSDGWQTLVNTHTEFGKGPALKSRLVEVLPFAAALMPRHMRDAAISDVTGSNDRHLIALTFLETKLYSHLLWSEFVDSTQVALVDRPESEWDAEWLREVHLFLVVASDAGRSAAVLPGIARSDSVLRFFKDFAQKSSSAIAKLIGKYSEQDAAAAFRVAALCGIDIFRMLPEIVIECADQPPFVAVALEQSARDPSTINEWATLFAEAGLRSSAAASVLTRCPQRPWRKLACAVAGDHSWHIHRIIEPSHYTDCLALGTANIANITPAVTPGLYELSQMPGPNVSQIRSVVASTIARFGSLLFVVCYFAMIPGSLILDALYKNATIAYQLGSATFLVGIAICTLDFILFIGAMYWVRVYADLINVDSTSRVWIIFSEIISSVSNVSRFLIRRESSARYARQLDRIDPKWSIKSIFLSREVRSHGNQLLKLRVELRRTAAGPA